MAILSAIEAVSLGSTPSSYLGSELATSRFNRVEAIYIQTSAACTQCWAGRISVVSPGPGDGPAGDPPVGDEGPDPFLPMGDVATLGDEAPDPIFWFPVIIVKREIQCTSNSDLKCRYAGRRLRSTDLGSGEFQD